MPWAKFSDDAHRNEHILALSHAAYRLWSTAIMDNRGYEGGESAFISRPRAEALMRQQRVTSKALRELTTAGRWIVDTDGWVIRNYEKYLPSRREVAADHEPDPIKQAAGIKSAAQRQQTGSTLVTERQQTGNPVARGPNPIPNPEPIVLTAPLNPYVHRLDAITEVDPATDLLLWWHEFVGRQISEDDRIAAPGLVVDCPRLGVAGIKARIQEHADWRVKNSKDPIHTLLGYRFTLAKQEIHLADQDVPKPRSMSSSGTTRLFAKEAV